MNINSAENILLDHGYPPIGNIQQDHKIHRFGKDKKYWCTIYDNWVVAGDWSGQLPDVSEPINKEDYKSLTTQQKEESKRRAIELKKLQIQERERLQEDVSKKAANDWDNLSECGTSEYLKKKGLVAVTGIRFGNTYIATSIIDNSEKIHSLQFIYDDGKKHFIKNGKIKGCYSKFGNEESNQIYICEGVATGLSILQSSPDSLVIVAYFCHNLKEAARSIISKYSNRNIIIAGDNDVCKEINVGKNTAENVAKELNLQFVLPSFKDVSNSPSDFDDLRQLEGLNEVIRQLKCSTQSTTSKKKNSNNTTSEIRTISIKEFLQMKLPEREYVIEPFFPKQGLMMIYAERGVGKTFFALLLACKMASGSNLFNERWRINKQFKVLYIDGEMPANTMQERLASILANTSEEEDNNNLSIITPDLQEYGLLPDLASSEGQKQLEKDVNASNVIVVDNLSTLCRSGKENESDSWNPIAQWALKLRTQGKSIIFVHHAGKNNKQRGTSKKEDILDTVINLKRPNDYNAEQGARFEIHFEKSRGFAGEEAKPFEVNLELIEGQANWEITEIEDLKLKQVKELDELKLSQREIAQEMGISASTVNRLLKKAKEVAV